VNEVLQGEERGGAAGVSVMTARDSSRRIRPARGGSSCRIS
jgi:hypothetical protein